MKRINTYSIVISVFFTILLIVYFIHNNKPQNSKLFGESTVVSLSIEESIATELDVFMNSININKLIVFRLLSYDCSECKRYFTDQRYSNRKYFLHPLQNQRCVPSGL